MKAQTVWSCEAAPAGLFQRQLTFTFLADFACDSSFFRHCLSRRLSCRSKDTFWCFEKDRRNHCQYSAHTPSVAPQAVIG